MFKILATQIHRPLKLQINDILNKKISDYQKVNGKRFNQPDTWKAFTVSDILPDELKRPKYIEKLIDEADKACDKRVPYLRLKLYENLDEGISVVLFNFRLSKDGKVIKGNPEGTLLHVYNVSKEKPCPNKMFFLDSGSNTESEMATKWHTHQSPCCSLVIDEKNGSFSEKVIEFKSKEAQVAWESAEQPDLTNVKLDERPVDSNH